MSLSSPGQLGDRFLTRYLERVLDWRWRGFPPSKFRQITVTAVHPERAPFANPQFPVNVATGTLPEGTVVDCTWIAGNPKAGDIWWGFTRGGPWLLEDLRRKKGTPASIGS